MAVVRVVVVVAVVELVVGVEEVQIEYVGHQGAGAHLLVHQSIYDKQ